MQAYPSHVSRTCTPTFMKDARLLTIPGYPSPVYTLP